MEHRDQVYNTTRICRRVRPVNLNPADDRLFCKEYEREIGPCRIETLTQGTIFDSRLFRQESNNLRLGELIRSSPGRLRAAQKVGRHTLASLFPAVKIDSGSWVVDDWSHGYFHWITEALCKLELLRSLSINEPVLLPGEYRRYPFIEESLDLLGLTCHYLSELRISKIDQLTTVSLDFPTGNYNCQLLRHLAERFTSRLPGPAQHPERRVWISRAQASRRTIRNEDELRPVLEKHRFEVVALERYSLREQIDLLQRSAIIAGLHGAGLTNMLFLPKQAKVVEIRRRDDDHSNCYYAMASALSLDYYYLLAEPLDADLHGGDCRLDADQLDRLLLTLDS